MMLHLSSEDFYTTRQRENDRGRILSTLSNTTSSIGNVVGQAVSTPRTCGQAAPEPCTCNHSKKRPHRDSDWDTQAPPIKRTSCHQTRSAMENSQSLLLTDAKILHMVYAFINGLQAGMPDNMVSQ